MPIASANPFPSMLYVEGTTPASPSSGQQRLFVRSSDHVLCMVNSSGTVTPLSGSLTNPMSAIGDIIQGGTAGAPEALAAPLTGKVLTGAGVTTRVAYKYPPGYEFDYVQKTTNTSVTGTSEGTSNTVLTGAAVTYDGSTTIEVHFYAPLVNKGTTETYILLREGSTTLAYLAIAAVSSASPVNGYFRLTPTNASHTYLATAFVDAGTGTVGAGAGGSDYAPCFMRITKV